MQRVLTALMTFLSLLAANLVPAGAQSPPADANGQGRAPIADVLELPAGRTVPTLVVRDKTFVLSGHVAQDVMAINCHTVIRPGASVGNVLTAIGGTVQDENEGRVRVVQQSADLLPYLQQTIIQSVAAPPRTVHVSHVVVQSQSPKKSCAGAQFALFLVGLLSGLIALVVAPGAPQRLRLVVSLRSSPCSSTHRPLKRRPAVPSLCGHSPLATGARQPPGRDSL